MMRAARTRGASIEWSEPFKDTALIEVRLVTGKRNQIRLQARLRGHTLVGEQRYVYGPDDLRFMDFPRQALHAQSPGPSSPGGRAFPAIRGAPSSRPG